MKQNDIADLLDFLSRVVPRGKAEADRLEYLIVLLQNSLRRK